MIAPGERPRIPTPLHRVLALAAAAVGAMALVQRAAPRVSPELFDRDPAARVTGVLLGTLAWGAFVAARLTTTGLRRAIGRAAALALAVAAAARLAGPGTIQAFDARMPWSDAPGLRAGVGAVGLALAAGVVWWLSPLRRRRAR